MNSKGSSDNTDKQKRRVFGRRIGRPLSKTRKEAINGLLPELGISGDLLHKTGTLTPASLFGKTFNRFVLEIGFGNGEHLNALIERYPETGFMGAEPFINGMAAFLKDRKNKNNENLRVLMDDALLLVKALETESLERIYILNPDPWPKTRHHKRRIINQKNLTAFARTLKTGGEIVMATDVDDLAEWMVTECSNHPQFEWTADNKKDWETPPPEWIETRYAFKGRTAGRRQSFLIFRKSKNSLQNR